MYFLGFYLYLDKIFNHFSFSLKRQYFFLSIYEWYTSVFVTKDRSKLFCSSPRPLTKRKTSKKQINKWKTKTSKKPKIKIKKSTNRDYEGKSFKVFESTEKASTIFWFIFKNPWIQACQTCEIRMLIIGKLGKRNKRIKLWKANSLYIYIYIL